MNHSAEGKWWVAWHADTIDVARAMPDKSVDFSVYSPPFSALYSYSASPRDLGNVHDDAEFFAHYDFLIKEQCRVMKPGRLIAQHCMQLPTSKERDGYIGLRDFRGALIRAYEAVGFIYHSEVCIWKDPVTAMQRTKALGLLHKTIRKDSAMARNGIADYVVVMRTPGMNDDAIAHSHDEFPVAVWQRYASPVWATSEGLDDEGFHVLSAKSVPNDDDTSGINPSDTLQFRSVREESDQRHIAPLQLGVIRRCIRLWSNPGDVVWSPFMGIGSEGHVALQMGRRFVGAELKVSYFNQAVRNLREAENVRQGSLFEDVSHEVSVR